MLGQIKQIWLIFNYPQLQVSEKLNKLFSKDKG